LSKFLKIVSAAPFRLIRQQQRGEIMKNLPNFVKHFVQLFLIFPLPPAPPENPGTAREGALYTYQKCSQAPLENIKNEIPKPQIDSPAVAI